jgi:hypothetical protein
LSIESWAALTGAAHRTYFVDRDAIGRSTLRPISAEAFEER